MVSVKKLVLDVLKPHQPNSLDFARAIAATGEGYRIAVTVTEVDEKTETVVIEIEGESIDFDEVQKVIEAEGGSLHSIDAVEVQNSGN